MCAQVKLFTAKIKKGNNCVNISNRVTVLKNALSLMAVYQCIKFYLIPFHSF